MKAEEKLMVKRQPEWRREPIVKFISRPTIQNLFQWQLSLDLQSGEGGDICETMAPREAGEGQHASHKLLQLG